MPAPPQTRARVRTHAQAPLPASAGDAMLLWTVLAEAPTHSAAIGVRVARARVKVESNRFFKEAQRRVAAPLVPSALDALNTSTQNALQPSCGVEERPACTGTNRGGSSLSMASLSVSASRPQLDVQRPHTPPGTHAQAVASLGMEPSNVLLHRKSNTLTPYNPDAWLKWLTSFNLLERYPNLYHSLIDGFDVGILSISRTYVPLITHLSLSILKFTMKLWKTSLGKEDILAPSRRPNLRPSLAPSNPLLFPWYPNQASQGNTARSMTSHIPMRRTKTLSPPSIQASTHMISPVPGELSQRCASSFTGSHQVLRLPFETYQRPTTPYPLTTDNGQDWSSASRRKTASSPTSATILGSPQQVEHMACSLTQEQISCARTESDPFQSGSMTTYSFASHTLTLPHTTPNASHGTMQLKTTEDKSTKVAACGTEEMSCQMGDQRSLTRTCPSPYVIYHLPLHALLTMRFLLMLMQISIAYPMSSEFLGNTPRRCLSATSSHIWASFGTFQRARLKSPWRRNASIVQRLKNGRRSHGTLWQKYRSSTASYFTPPWWSQLDERISPIWKPCSPSSITVLSCHTPHPAGIGWGALPRRKHMIYRLVIQ